MLTRWLPLPYGFTFPMAVISFSLGLSRPPGNNLVLEQVDRHAGAASSLLVFIYFMLGAFTMWLISFNWSDKVRLIGIMGAAMGGLLLILWLCLPQNLTRSAQLLPPR
jgi:DHA1 family bicyclomycin/chloramphenicol resistance-like MFS transporter